MKKTFITIFSFSLITLACKPKVVTQDHQTLMLLDTVHSKTETNYKEGETKISLTPRETLATGETQKLMEYDLEPAQKTATKEVRNVKTTEVLKPVE